MKKVRSWVIIRRLRIPERAEQGRHQAETDGRKGEALPPSPRPQKGGTKLQPDNQKDSDGTWSHSQEIAPFGLDKWKEQAIWLRKKFQTDSVSRARLCDWRNDG